MEVGYKRVRHRKETAPLSPDTQFETGRSPAIAEFKGFNSKALMSHEASRDHLTGFGEVMSVSVWNRVTTDFYGRSVYGSYVIENDTIITVKTPRGSKAMQLGGFNPNPLAERLLRELAAEGKA
jgi:hypothetical protein